MNIKKMKFLACGGCNAIFNKKINYETIFKEKTIKKEQKKKSYKNVDL